ncbi:MAG: peptidase [Sedimenticola sp.]|nr:peptidase [Sedimenticola sp.]MCW8921253.1 peptidase [Sedimenticola sp.]MCW8947823.1 peptidase [Sedimenticola sp.]MCW8950734.1 peptidase [Sedimenticola sp.]MCW8974871.1 peptidase [Sedimenticola sp.]
MIVRDSSAKTTLTGLLVVRRWIPLAYVFVLLVSLGVSAPWAVADEDQEITSTMEGIAPLQSLLAQIDETYPGQVLEVKLEKEDYGKEDIVIYEVKLLTKKGSVLKLEYDAINLELLKIKGRPDN